MKHGLRRWQLALMLCLMASMQTTVGAPVLETEIARLSAPIGGEVGVAAWRLDGKGERILVNAGERFPMASTFKVAVAGAILAGVDAGRLKLDQIVAIDPKDIVPSDGIATLAIHPGLSMSVHNLLELMLTVSDNTATDVLMRLAGGPQAVTAWVRKQGVEDQRIDRNTAGLLRDFFDLPPGAFNEALQAAMEKDPQLEERGMHPNPAFDKDVRDTSTPSAMAQLLTRIFNRQSLSGSSTQVLIDIMERCHIGNGRLPGRMPAGTVIAHKTGTIGGTVNDVGVMTLPEGKGQVVIAVFIKQSDRSMEERERVIAEIARSVRDYFLLAETS